MRVVFLQSNKRCPIDHFSSGPRTCKSGAHSIRKGNKLLGLVLTGMGSDGLRGSQAITAAGGNILAQDEGSSVVWGMPGQVAHAGLCSAVLPLSEIAPQLTRLFAGDKA